MQEVCEVTGMAKVNTTAYHPQTDGLLKILIVLSDPCWLNTAGPQWDIHLQQLLFAYRTKSPGVSPFSLVYGRDARLPTDTVLDTPPSPF